MTDPDTPTRRSFLLKLGIALNAIAAALLAAPIVGYLLSPGRRKRMAAALSWVSLDETETYPRGQTRMATYRNPSTRPWDGATGDLACWVRRLPGGDFQVFAVNCAHLGCPVRWMATSGLFLCPCHGGAYYADGSRASGPPPRGLFQYEHKVEDGRLWIRAGMMPTLGHVEASLNARPGDATLRRKDDSPCG